MVCGMLFYVVGANVVRHVVWDVVEHVWDVAEVFVEIAAQDGVEGFVEDVAQDV